jgi:hypothetical protein
LFWALRERERERVREREREFGREKESGRKQCETRSVWLGFTPESSLWLTGQRGGRGSQQNGHQSRG